MKEEESFNESFFKEAFFSSLERRQTIIECLDNQINIGRTLFIPIVFSLITAAVSTNNAIYIYISLFVDIIFWVNETQKKQFQKGYVYMSNKICEEFSITQDNNISELVRKYAFDLNGFNTCKDKFKEKSDFKKCFKQHDILTFYLMVLILIFLVLGLMKTGILAKLE